MFNYDRTDIERIALSTVGALILSTACILSAVGPAQALERNAPVAQVQIASTSVATTASAG